MMPALKSGKVWSTNENISTVDYSLILTISAWLGDKMNAVAISSDSSSLQGIQTGRLNLFGQNIRDSGHELHSVNHYVSPYTGG
jgi:hypothetical protein